MTKVDDIAQEYNDNFEKNEEEARKERLASVNWELIRERCSPKQILAIQLFVEHRLFEGAASIASVSVPDFMDLLLELEISMA